ncbi:Cyclin-dependent kinases regulatory subunit 1 [Cardamine amara subsp. amara]|uniref:Cyclin-dependent kinases regulatory subunit n=2 Tax=Cardamine amara subsp. amara TaxID=228776 RepID=A0ABD1B655_CARAN
MGLLSRVIMQEISVYVSRFTVTREMGQIQYSEKYFDDTFEYRHVVLPPEVSKLLPKNRLLSENEWRAIGVQQSRGWVHYAIHRPEPHIMLFRRPLNYQQQQENQAQNLLVK